MPVKSLLAPAVGLVAGLAAALLCGADVVADFDIRDYGGSVAKAAEAAAQAGGGRIVVPPGIWKSGTIWLKDHCELHLEKGATPYDPEGKKQAGRKPLVSNEAVFFPVADLPKHFRIDTIIVGEAYHTDIDDICACVRRAAERKEVLSITSHGISPDAKGINMKTEWLERILAAAKDSGLAVIGFDELP